VGRVRIPKVNWQTQITWKMADKMDMEIVGVVYTASQCLCNRSDSQKSSHSLMILLTVENVHIVHENL